MSTDYDVVVVGARVSGAATAMLLARAGARVALIDRSSYGTGTVSTHAFMRAGVLQLSRWGVLPAIVAARTPPVRRTTFHYAGEDSAVVTIRPSAGVEALYAPRRDVLDRILVDHAVAAGAEVIHETSVSGLIVDDRGRVTGVRGRDRRGRAIRVRSTVTVGADGLRSSVAAAVGARVHRRGRSASAVLYRYLDTPVADGYEWAYGDGAGAGLIPTNDGQTCAFVGTSPERMRVLRRSGTEAAFTTLLDHAAPRLTDRVRAVGTVGAIRGWAGVPGHVRQSWGPGWALVGDAGYFKDPITTHGMTDALRDAELLARALLESLQQGGPESVALARYQSTRDRLSAALFDATEAVASYTWDIPTVRQLLRRVSAAMSDELDHLQQLEARPGDLMTHLPGDPASA